jgi:hypothetical protein
MQEPSTWFGKGMLLINKGLYDQAEYQFRAFLERYPDFVPALIGRAALHYYQKQCKYFDFNVDYLILYGKYGRYSMINFSNAQF